MACTGNYETCDQHGGECMECSKRDCPYNDDFHYHHDGCPSCPYADDCTDLSCDLKCGKYHARGAFCGPVVEFDPKSIEPSGVAPLSLADFKAAFDTTAYTSGPLVVERETVRCDENEAERYTIVQQLEDDPPLAIIEDWCMGDHAANARLFAASPALLETLKSLIEIIENDHRHNPKLGYDTDRWVAVQAAKDAVWRATTDAPVEPSIITPVTFPEVAIFAGDMRRQLFLNVHKGSWKDLPPLALLERAKEELLKLEGEVRILLETSEPEARVEVKRRLLTESADVANMAMMVADVCGSLKGEP